MKMMKDPFSLAGAKVAVTGASSGIGRALFWAQDFCISVSIDEGWPLGVIETTVYKQPLFPPPVDEAARG